MSRVAKQIIEIPSGVNFQVLEDHILCKGSAGENRVHLPTGFKVELKDGKVKIERANEEVSRASWGALVSNLKNAVLGSTKQFEQNINLVGVGYKAIKQGDALELHLGYSHSINFPVPEGVDIEVKKPNELTVRSHNKQALGETCAKLEKLRKPEPYKGKGVVLAGKFYLRKEGKKK